MYSLHYSSVGLLRAANDQPREAAYYFSASDAGVLLIAGLWDEWNDITSGEPLLSCTMIVTEANEFAGRVHDRMPVFPAGDSFETWLDGSAELSPFPYLKLGVHSNVSPMTRAARSPDRRPISPPVATPVEISETHSRSKQSAWGIGRIAHFLAIVGRQGAPA
jgi:hypothetical protein